MVAFVRFACSIVNVRGTKAIRKELNGNRDRPSCAVIRDSL